MTLQTYDQNVNMPTISCLLDFHSLTLPSIFALKLLTEETKIVDTQTKSI